MDINEYQDVVLNVLCEMYPGDEASLSLGNRDDVARWIAHGHMEGIPPLRMAGRIIAAMQREGTEPTARD